MQAYFDGWYLKQQTPHTTIAVIPAVHMDERGGRCASVQVITDDVSYAVDFSDFELKGLQFQVGENYFSDHGMSLNLKDDTMEIRGDLSFGAFTKPLYDIMGPFALMPWMECRHRVFSLYHTVDGSLWVNGIEKRFEHGIGYMEGDRGRSFPRRYTWTQCSFERGDSLMLSIAEIPFMGGRFTGVIGIVWLDGKEYRIATYLGAQVVSITNRMVAVRQGKLYLEAELLAGDGQVLRAPTAGSMTRRIRENAACCARYCFQKNGEVLLNRTSERAGFESEWN